MYFIISLSNNVKNATRYAKISFTPIEFQSTDIVKSENYWANNNI